MTHILGLNYYFHDSSACIVRDGELICAIEEERLSRDKHTTAFPALAIERCLQIAGIGPRDIDAIAWAVVPSHSWAAKLRYAAKAGPHAGDFVRAELRRASTRQRGFTRWLWRTWPNPLRRPRIHNVQHHIAHVVGAYLVSPYESGALLGIDGSGEWATSYLGSAQGTRIECYGQSYFPDSLGSFYETVTQFCGFRPNYDEGKTMGLAPYGDPERFYETVARMVQVDRDGGIHVDLSRFRYQFHGYDRFGPEFVELFGTPRRRGEDFEQHHKDLAAAFQRVLEDRVLEICALLHRRSGARHLVVSGGVALNSVMNGRIIEDSPFDDVYAMPGAGDSGTCIGAAFHVHNVLSENPRRCVHDDPYVGTSYTNDDFERVLRARGLAFERRDDVEALAAEALAAGKIIGWFQGKMEFGPRALGNRSILANPTVPEMKAILNARVKHREAFRPFAPSVIAEARSELFDAPVDAPFMLKVFPVRPDKRDRLPAITHVDGSARLQTVDRRINPRYHALITAVGERTGVPVVLNTSFNVMGQPIVESPEQALDCYLSTGIDELFLGDCHLAKPSEV